MIDELLGRAALKARIETLEEERDRAHRRLDAETDRRRDAVRDRQVADRRVNELEDKIAELEGRLAQDAQTGDDRSYAQVSSLGYERTEELVHRVASVRTEPEGALSAYVGDDGRPDAVTHLFGSEIRLIDRASPCLVYADDERLVRVLFSPPLPPSSFCSWDDRFRIELPWFVPSGTFALALVRSDLFAIGEYEADERVSMEGFRSDVKEAHSKGGFSQRRFERGRDAQIDEHLDRCRASIESVDPNRLIVVGERTVLSEFRSDAIATATVDATGNPEDALEDAFQRFWRTQVYVV